MCKIIQISQSTENPQNLVNPTLLAIHKLPLHLQLAALLSGCNPLCESTTVAFSLSELQGTKSSAFHLSQCHCIVSFQQNNLKIFIKHIASRPLSGPYQDYRTNSWFPGKLGGYISQPAGVSPESFLLILTLH